MNHRVAWQAVKIRKDVSSTNDNFCQVSTLQCGCKATKLKVENLFFRPWAVWDGNRADANNVAKKLLRILTFDDKTCFWNKYKNIQPLWRPLATCWSTRRNWKQHLTRYPLLKHEAATMNAVTARERNICIKWTFGMVNRTMMLICGKQFEQAEKWTKMSKVWVSSADGEV